MNSLSLAAAITVILLFISIVQARFKFFFFVLIPLIAMLGGISIFLKDGNLYPVFVFPGFIFALNLVLYFRKSFKSYFGSTK